MYRHPARQTHINKRAPAFRVPHQRAMIAGDLKQNVRGIANQPQIAVRVMAQAMLARQIHHDSGQLAQPPVNFAQFST